MNFSKFAWVSCSKLARLSVDWVSEGTSLRAWSAMCSCRWATYSLKSSLEVDSWEESALESIAVLFID